MNTDTFALTSIITANITALPFDQDVSKIPMATREIVLNVKKIQKELNILKATPWWIPVVSAIVATAIVAGIAAILHHVNFNFYLKSVNEIVELTICLFRNLSMDFSKEIGRMR